MQKMLAFLLCLTGTALAARPHADLVLLGVTSSGGPARRDASAGSALVNAPLILQNPQLPRGCEFTSLAMLLAHAGKPTDKMVLASRVRKVPFTANGKHGNPNDGFVGDMYTFSRPGYGVYHAPVRDLAEQYLPGQIEDFSGSSFDEVLARLSAGKPVWVITNARWKELPASEFETWQTSSGPIRITYHEHSVLVTGFNDHTVFINDPLDGNGKDKALPRANFEAAWRQMGSQAISYR